MKRCYQALVRLYPYDYQVSFTAEMVTVFEHSALECRAQGLLSYLRFCSGDLTGLVLAAPREWMAKWTTPRMIRGRALPDLRMMRPAGVSRETHFAGAGK
ncbi:MAG TPA: hypothetical protein VEU96_03285 [Bryobacteraceae bacterium]|nr:hypothetical protein [Bryobacteraceae bacterium]